jgi:hypothetical protein
MVLFDEAGFKLKLARTEPRYDDDCGANVVARSE